MVPTSLAKLQMDYRRPSLTNFIWQGIEVVRRDWCLLAACLRSDSTSSRAIDNLIVKEAEYPSFAKTWKNCKDNLVHISCELSQSEAALASLLGFAKVRQMVEHSLHLLLRERSKERDS